MGLGFRLGLGFRVKGLGFRVRVRLLAVEDEGVARRVGEQLRRRLRLLLEGCEVQRALKLVVAKVGVHAGRLEQSGECGGVPSAAGTRHRRRAEESARVDSSDATRHEGAHLGRYREI